TVRIADVQIAVMEGQTERLCHLTIAGCRWSSTARTTRTTRSAAASSGSRTLGVREPLVRQSVFVCGAKNHDGVLRRLRNEKVIVGRKYHHPGVRHVVRIKFDGEARWNFGHCGIGPGNYGSEIRLGIGRCGQRRHILLRENHCGDSYRS